MPASPIIHVQSIIWWCALLACPLFDLSNDYLPKYVAPILLKYPSASLEGVEGKTQM